MLKLNLVALGRMEELVTEMKNDVNKLPAELIKLPCVTKQLNLSAYNILSKLANQKTPSNSKTEQHKTTAATTTTTIVKLSTTTSTTANTTATTTTTTGSSSSLTSSTHKSNTSVIQQTLNKYITSTKTTKSSSNAVHSYALQTAGGSLLLYNAGGTQNTATQYIVGGNTGGSTQQFALAPSTGGSSGSSRHTQYIQGTDGNLYAITTRPSQGQNIVLSTSQGVLYWPVQQGTTTQTATAIIPQQSQQQYATTATMPGSAVIAKENSKGKLVPTAITVATPITSNAPTKTVVVPSTSTATQVSVITID